MQTILCPLFLRRAIRYLAFSALIVSFPVIACGQTITENAQNLNIGFNGPDPQFPYMDTFYAATTRRLDARCPAIAIVMPICRGISRNRALDRDPSAQRALAPGLRTG